MRGEDISGTEAAMPGDRQEQITEHRTAPALLTANNSDGQTLTAGGDSGIIFTNKQRGKKFGKHCCDWGLDPSSAKDRKQLENNIHDIVTN